MRQSFPVKSALIALAVLFALLLGSTCVLLFALPVDKASLQNSIAVQLQGNELFGFSATVSVNELSDDGTGVVDVTEFLDDLIWQQSDDTVYLHQRNSSTGEDLRTLLWNGDTYSAFGEAVLQPAQTTATAEDLLAPLQRTQKLWESAVSELTFTRSPTKNNGLRDYDAPAAAQILQVYLDSDPRLAGLTAQDGRLVATVSKANLFAAEALKSIRMEFPARIQTGETVNVHIFLHLTYQAWESSPETDLQQQIAQVQ